MNGRLKSFAESATIPIYDETIEVGSTITAGTNITLPSSGTYSSLELEVYLNGVRIKVVDDYNYVGSPPRTQITMTYDLIAGDKLRFRVDRSA